MDDYYKKNQISGAVSAIPFHSVEFTLDFGNSFNISKTLDNRPLSVDEYDKIKLELEKRYYNRPNILQRRLKNIKK